jgi:hypothetical protein
MDDIDRGIPAASSFFGPIFRLALLRLPGWLPFPQIRQ